MSNYLSDEEYDFIYSRVPRICVDLLIVNPQGQLLLTKRTIEPYIGHWHFPGGRIKFKESVEDAVKRIAKNEIGIELTDVGKMKGICEFPEEIQKGQDRHSISIVHEIKLTQDVQISSPDMFEWFTELPLPIIPAQKYFLTKNYSL